MNEISKVIDSEYHPLSVVKYYLRNFKYIILFTLIPFFIGLGSLLYLKPLVQSENIVYASNILLQDSSVSSLLSEQFLFNASNLSKAVERSNLQNKINIDQNLIESFSIASGHSDLNILVKDYMARNSLEVSRALYFKPEDLKNMIQKLIDDGLRFRVINYKNRVRDLNKYEVNILLTNLVNVINENIQVSFDTTNIGLKKIAELKVDSPISSVDVSKINNRLNLIREYINLLSSDYKSFAPDINLKIFLSDLDSNEDIFNYVIQENNLYRDIIEKRIKLDIEAITKRINSSIDKLEFIGSKNDIIEPGTGNNNQSINADSSFIDTILALGDKAASIDQRSEYLNEIGNLQNNKISLERRLKDLELRTEFEFPISDAQDYLISELNITSSKLNDYIDIVQDTKRNNEAIVLLSTANQIDESYFAKIFKPIIYLLFGSILFSISAVTFRLLMNK
tara:strand:- start:5039 stop:6397 length:1359 start_codon:yes stop_codon:yes gene_type:complete